MRIMLDLARNEETRRAWQELMSSNFMLKLKAGIREAMPCETPNPNECTEGFLGITVGRQTTRDYILDKMMDPDYWTRILAIEQESHETIQQAIQAYREDMKERGARPEDMTDDKILELLQKKDQ